MKNRLFMVFISAATLFAACEPDVRRPDTAAAGTITLRLLVGNGQETARTVLPAVSLSEVTRYELRGGKTGNTETTLLPSFTAVSGTTVALDTGAWDLTLNAYRGDALILQGKLANKTIAASSTTLAFTVSPLNSGQGSFSITVNFPSGAGISAAAAVIDGGTPETLTVSGNSATYTKQQVNAGNYFVSVRLYDSDAALRAAVSELVVVRLNTVSAKTVTLAGADLKPEASTVQLGAATPEAFANALAAIQGSAETDFTITVGADISLAPQPLSGADYDGKTITVKGDTSERIISLSGNGSLFTVGEDVTLVLDNNITLQGKSDNNAPLVKVNDGDLVMNNGAKITGNTYVTTINLTGGGGVYLDGGVFEITGGIIENNLVKNDTSAPFYSVRGSVSGGGGILAANNSTVKMSGGSIRNNTVDTNLYYDGGGNGGGICLTDNSRFEMSAGYIEGNVINHKTTYTGAAGRGGGVSGHSASIIMTGGTIRNNTITVTGTGYYTNAQGGGVSIVNIGSFVMEGGVISGNAITSSYASKAYGGGVCLDFGSDMTMTKTGGIIYGQDAVGNDADGYPLKNTTYAGNGQAVYVELSPVRKRENTAGESINLDSAVTGAAGGWE